MSGKREHWGDVFSADCPCRDLLDIVAHRWSALAIAALDGGVLRFGELQQRLHGVSPKVLTTTLRRLEGYGLISRRVIPAVPLHVEYDLTDLGRSALVPLRMMRDWAEAHYDEALAGRSRTEDRGTVA